MSIEFFRNRKNFLLVLDYDKLIWTQVRRGTWKATMLLAIEFDLNYRREPVIIEVLRCLMRIPAKRSRIFRDCFKIWARVLPQERIYLAIKEYLTQKGFINEGTTQDSTGGR